MSSAKNSTAPPDDGKIVNLADRQPRPNQNEILVRADKALESMQGSFLAEAQGQLAQLEEALSGVEAAGDDSAARDCQFVAAYGSAHEIRGQAGSFNYGLLTSICTSLCDLIELHQQQDPRPDLLAPMRLHVSMVREVLERDLTGEGGNFGIALMGQIDQMNRLLAPQIAQKSGAEA